MGEWVDACDLQSSRSTAGILRDNLHTECIVYNTVFKIIVFSYPLRAYSFHPFL